MKILFESRVDGKRTINKIQQDKEKQALKVMEVLDNMKQDNGFRRTIRHYRKTNTTAHIYHFATQCGTGEGTFTIRVYHEPQDEG